MSESKWKGDDDISLVGLGTTLLRNRWRIARWMLLGAVVAGLWAFSKPAVYSASASFVPQGNDVSRTGLASFAGQFGVALPNTNPSLSPEFYSALLKSHVLLRDVAKDTFVVRGLGNRRVRFVDLFKVQGASEKEREDKAIRLLMDIVKTSVAKTTGIVEVSVATRWPSVSLAIVARLVEGVNAFNQRTRQVQAADERKFVEGRLTVAGAELRQAEGQLEDFLTTNRQFGVSSELTMQRDRLQRNVTLRQQVFTSLTQSLEEARIREVRDTPVITVIEPPWVPTMPEPRRRAALILLGSLFGASVGAARSLVSGMMLRRRQYGDGEAGEFLDTLSEAKGDLLLPVRWLRARRS